MHSFALVAGLLAHQALAFPWVSNVPGVDSSLFQNERRQQPGSAATCPFNANHTGAAPYTAQYPYCGAKNGVPGKQFCPNNLVPAPGDKAHQFTPAGANDIRGPCPGINTAANHNFLSHDGITTFTELVDMQQNVYGVGYDLAVLLATLGVGLDGDPITEKVSIGCDATSRTATPGLGPELGLDGHNKFEGDTSLTRNDYFLADGDNYLMNGTLFGMMEKTCGNNFGRENIALYRAQRYNQSRSENGQFYYGPKSLLLYGAASFLYELFPSLGNAGPPSLAIQESFFGAHPNGKGGYTYGRDEKIPANWYSRATPYSIPLVANEIFQQYELHPVEFGGNLGSPGDFTGFGQNGVAVAPSFSNSTGVECLLYQIATENVPASLTGVTELLPEVLSFMQGKMAPIQANSPCPINYNNA